MRWVFINCLLVNKRKSGLKMPDNVFEYLVYGHCFTYCSLVNFNIFIGEIGHLFERINRH